MESSDYKIKFKVLFDKLFHDKIELSAEQTENLVKHLDGSHDKCVAKILETPFFANLLLYALKNYELATISVKIFFARLMRNVLSNEVLFNRFMHMQGFDLLIFHSEALHRLELIHSTSDAYKELHEAMVQLCFALVSHYSGVKFFVESKIYQKGLNPKHTLRPPLAVGAAYEIIAKLIWKLNEYEEEAALLQVLEHVVNPLGEFTSTGTNLKADSNVGSPESLVPFVQTLVYILGEVEHLVVPNNVVPILTQVFSIENKLSTALGMTRDPTLARLLADASLRYYYAASRQVALRCPDSEPRGNQEFHTAFNKIMATLIQKRSYVIILEFLSQCHAFWHRVESIGSPIEFEKFSKKYLLQNQFVIIMLNPLFIKQAAKRLVANPMLVEARDMFHSDLSVNFPRDTVNLAFDLKDIILESTGNDLLPACKFALRELLRLKRLLGRPQACVVFQTLFYALSDFVLSDGSDLVLLANPLPTQDDEQYLALLLDAIGMLLDGYEISWNESLEIVELQAALMNLIKQNMLPSELLVQTVILITTTVRKLLSPELALLMESRRGGSLREVAEAARALLARPEPAVRLAALRLALSFMEIAYVKFMPLRAVISTHGLVRGAAECALNETEACAQAAALRCLAAATRCEDLWTELLEQCRTLYEQLVSIMRHNIDGEVRKEAVNVLSQVYVYRKVTDGFTRYLSKAMAPAATEDPHWPVRLAAIYFWKEFIKKQFTDKGMIDGTFPTVTFCKEKRKIIVLNNKEIHKQLETIMRHLANTGCLAVLIKCMHPSNNTEVIEKTYRMAKRLVEGLDQYKYSGSSVAPSRPVIVERQCSSESADMQIDGNDIFMEIFECLGSDSSGSDTMSPIEIIQPSTFIETVREVAKNRPPKVDLGTLIDEIVSL